ncbi:hypothetical protein LTR53_001438 [Teratosphaeriaceae sp. CCFEE 6253]|nr:hypothetical protein LTR53_001438 [Teratosphaeriaceae sp. CCFEE 6253]
MAASKEPTPASDAANAKQPEKSVFTPKEEAVLKVAWSCLKSGPPEIDFEKLVKAYGFNTTKTAQNTWGSIKKKLNEMSPKVEAGEEAPKTPKSKATPRKRTKKAEEDGGEEAERASPEKKARKTPAKKGGKAAAAAAEEAKEEDVDGVKMEVDDGDEE